MAPPSPTLRQRPATPADVPLLAAMNKQLIEDEGHRNPMTVAELGERMRAWMADGSHSIVLFVQGERTVAYAAFRVHEDHAYVRQLFVARDARRQGIGREAMHMLETECLPPGKRIRLDVLAGNEDGRRFYEGIGFVPYSIAMEKNP